MSTEKQKEQQRKWYLENKERHSEKGKAYYLKNKEKVRAKGAEYYKNNKEKIYARQKKYVQENKDKLAPKRKEYTKRYVEANRELLLIEKRARYQRHKEEHFGDQLKRKYGISLQERNLLFESQKGRCAICNIHEDFTGKKLHTDHCHKTGKVRGLLCHKCNSGIGMLGDSSKILRSAIKYLNK